MRYAKIKAPAVTLCSRYRQDVFVSLLQFAIMGLVIRYLFFRAGWHLFNTLLYYSVIPLEREECLVFLSCYPFGAGGPR
ncbi:hypothetical protein E2C01_093875 [Portunus trituberculatus]|uniref:Uncharacterized protein n=1 Tax=Portunus trituberculatus TaxID=210409 RepID=A0A5B7JR02_PORTR|nr:hypothetical protein [Portunus trituberculatus]